MRLTFFPPTDPEVSQPTLHVFGLMVWLVMLGGSAYWAHTLSHDRLIGWGVILFGMILGLVILALLASKSYFLISQRLFIRHSLLSGAFVLGHLFYQTVFLLWRWIRPLSRPYQAKPWHRWWLWVETQFLVSPSTGYMLLKGQMSLLESHDDFWSKWAMAHHRVFDSIHMIQESSYLPPIRRLAFLWFEGYDAPWPEHEETHLSTKWSYQALIQEAWEEAKPVREARILQAHVADLGATNGARTPSKKRL